MDEPTETTRDTPAHRQFKLTPLPGAATDEAAPKGGRWKSGRRLLISGSAVAPFILTIRGRPAFARKNNCSVSLQMSARNSAPLGGDETGELGPCGNTVAYWLTGPPAGGEYAHLQSMYPSYTGNLHQAPFLAQTTSNNYLSINTHVVNTSGAVFTFATGSNLAFSTTPAVPFNFATALGGPKLTLTVTVPNTNPTPHTATYTDPGGNTGFIANMAAAVLNAASFGSSSFGYTDYDLIQLVNGWFTNLQTQATTGAGTESASTIVSTLQTLLTTDTNTLIKLNNQSNT